MIIDGSLHPPPASDREDGPTVLVVDDDQQTREEFCEFLSSVGYTCLAVTDGAEALRTLTRRPSIGIVMIDIAMPTMNGMSLLTELGIRFMPHRPLVPIVVTGTPMAETVITAMRAGAMDFLTKPVPSEDLLTSLRQASNKWLVMNSHFRMLALLEGSADIGSWSATAGEKAFGAATLSRDDLKHFVRSLIKMRHRRNDIFKSAKFSDPSWDILLDLTSASLEGRDVPAISTSAAAGVPLTTALRYVKNLTDDGIIRRWEDPDDKRRSLVRLDNDAFECMVEFLSHAHALLTAPRSSSQ